MNDNTTIDQAAQDQDDHNSMVESTVDRQIFTKMESDMSIETVRLKNGAEEVKSLVVVTMMSVKYLKDMGAYELVMLCRNPNHKPWGQTGSELKALSLATETDGKWYVHDSIRNIVLSAAKGEGLDMIFGNPMETTDAT